MSTKVYQGILLSPGFSFYDLQDYKKQITQKIRDHNAFEWSKILHKIVDLYTLDKLTEDQMDKVKNQGFILYSRDSWLLEHPEIGKFDIVVYPTVVRYQHNHITPAFGSLARTACASRWHDDFCEAFRSTINPFYYWNNTDKCDLVGESEWEERRTLWDIALNPSTISYRIRLCEDYEVSPRIDHVMRLKPSNESRAISVAKEIILNRFFNNFPSPFINSTIFEEVGKFDQYIRSPEGINEVSELSDSILPKLIDVDMEFLRKHDKR